MNDKERNLPLNKQEIADNAARKLANVAGDVSVLHIFNSEIVYVISTSEPRGDTNIFTAPFELSQSIENGRPGLTTVTNINGGVGNMLPEISLEEHIEAVSDSNPGTPIVMTQDVAALLGKDKDRPVTVIAYENGHCLLTGLNSRGIDLYIAPGIESEIQIGGTTIAFFSK